MNGERLIANSSSKTGIDNDGAKIELVVRRDSVLSKGTANVKIYQHHTAQLNYVDLTNGSNEGQGDIKSNEDGETTIIPFVFPTRASTSYVHNSAGRMRGDTTVKQVPSNFTAVVD